MLVNPTTDCYYIPGPCLSLGISDFEFFNKFFVVILGESLTQPIEKAEVNIQCDFYTVLPISSNL